MPKAKPVKVKKKCCKDKPRCATCPVVLMRLEQLGYAEQDPRDRRRYTMLKGVPRKAMVLARQR